MKDVRTDLLHYDGKTDKETVQGEELWLGGSGKINSVL